MRHIFEEIKRRNLVRVAITYAVAAWLILQVTEVLHELLSLPESVGPTVVMLVLLGFPLALLVAWFFELTPSGLKRSSQVDPTHSIRRQTGKRLNVLIIALLSTAVVVLLVDRFRAPATPTAAVAANAAPPLAADQTEATATKPKPAVVPPPRSLAVLPFANRGSEDNQFFVDGIHSDLLITLARIGDIKVVSRTSVQRYAGDQHETPLPEIAAALNVATVMEGSVQRSGDSVRISVQLIDAASDQMLWAERYDEQLSAENLFKIQSEIASQITQALQANLAPEEAESLQQQPTSNLAAYSAYLRGLQAFEQRGSALSEALREFEQATRLDPDFALAWARLAMAYFVRPSWELVFEESKWLQPGKAALARAQALAPQLGETLLAQATGSHVERIFFDPMAPTQPIEALYAQALARLPGSAQAYNWYGQLISGDISRFAESRALYEQAIALDPLTPFYYTNLALLLSDNRLYEDTEAQLAQAIALEPGYLPAWIGMAELQAKQGQLAKAWATAAEAARLDSTSFIPAFISAWIAVTLEDRARLAEVPENWIANNPDSSPAQQQFLQNLAASRNAQLEQRYSAALEILANTPSTVYQESEWESRWIRLLMGDFAGAVAMAETLTPGFLRLEDMDQQLRQTPGEGCLTAYALLRTGQDTLARELFTRTQDLRHALPKELAATADQRVDQYLCEAMAGNFEAAMRLLEARIDAGDYTVWESTRLDLFEPLRGDPRFEALSQRVQQTLAAQRAMLDETAQTTAGMN
ncbi:MAG: hypothetical protein HRU51_05990 [Xanthomonadales bacterium]|nr:hypothetical protein [Xanthomonadales bacterium]